MNPLLNPEQSLDGLMRMSEHSGEPALRNSITYKDNQIIIHKREEKHKTWTLQNKTMNALDYLRNEEILKEYPNIKRKYRVLTLAEYDEIFTFLWQQHGEQWDAIKSMVNCSAWLTCHTYTVGKNALGTCITERRTGERIEFPDRYNITSDTNKSSLVDVYQDLEKIKAHIHNMLGHVGVTKHESISDVLLERKQYPTFLGSSNASYVFDFQDSQENTLIFELPTLPNEPLYLLFTATPIKKARALLIHDP